MSTSPIDHLRDLAETEQGRARLADAHRYTQVGMCVSSVTHDINNHLGAVMAYAELLGMEHGDSESVHMVEEIIEAVKRSSTLIEDLTAVARKERVDVTRVPSTDIARRALELRMYDLKMAGVRVERVFPDEARLLSCDRPKVEQALLYLLSNSLESVLGTEKPAVRFTLLHDESGACFEVWDSGSGIPESLGDACFEPLVTTKGPPHLGLGLFAARRIAALHDGSLVYTPGAGMRLTIPWRNGMETGPA
jgi:C4-dicarboxylate-specific signal transduction histidine kinase